MKFLSKIYIFLTWLERTFFETFKFLSYKSKAKVVSIGNLSMGGTGKTPVLFQFLKELEEKQSGKKAVVLTRGYRCPWEKSFYELYGKGEHPFELTDEALMLNRRFPNVPIATKTAKASLSTITKIFVGSAVAVTVFACAYTLSSSSTSKETNNSITNQAISLHCEEKAKQQSQPKATPVNGKDLKNLNTELPETKSVPSSIKDN